MGGACRCPADDHIRILGHPPLLPCPRGRDTHKLFAARTSTPASYPGSLGPSPPISEESHVHQPYLSGPDFGCPVTAPYSTCPYCKAMAPSLTSHPGQQMHVCLGGLCAENPHKHLSMREGLSHFLTTLDSMGGIALCFEAQRLWTVSAWCPARQPGGQALPRGACGNSL